MSVETEALYDEYEAELDARVRVRAYALLMHEAAIGAMQRAEGAITEMLDARRRAEREVRNCHRACALAEDLIRLAADGEAA